MSCHAISQQLVPILPFKLFTLAKPLGLDGSQPNVTLGGVRDAASHMVRVIVSKDSQCFVQSYSWSTSAWCNIIFVDAQDVPVRDIPRQSTSIGTFRPVYWSSYFQSPGSAENSRPHTMIFFPIAAKQIPKHLSRRIGRYKDSHSN